MNREQLSEFLEPLHCKIEEFATLRANAEQGMRYHVELVAGALDAINVQRVGLGLLALAVPSAFAGGERRSVNSTPSKWSTSCWKQRARIWMTSSALPNDRPRIPIVP